jgi:hypothetical protein
MMLFRNHFFAAMAFLSLLSPPSQIAQSLTRQANQLEHNAPAHIIGSRHLIAAIGIHSASENSVPNGVEK